MSIVICSLSLKCQKVQNKDFFITSFTLKFSAQQEIFEVELVKMLFWKIIVTSKKAFQGTDSVDLHLGDPGYDRRLTLSKANFCLFSLICQILQNKTFFITSFKLKFSAQQEIFEVELVKLLFREIILTCKKAFQGLDIVRLYVCDPGYDRSLNLKLLRWPKIFIKKPLKPIFLFSYQHRKKILMFQFFFVWLKLRLIARFWSFYLDQDIKKNLSFLILPCLAKTVFFLTANFFYRFQLKNRFSFFSTFWKLSMNRKWTTLKVAGL